MSLLSKIGAAVFLTSSFLLLAGGTGNSPNNNSYSPAVEELRQKYVVKYYAPFFLSTAFLGAGMAVGGEVLDRRRQRAEYQPEIVQRG